MDTVWKAHSQPFSLWVDPEKNVHQIGSIVLELTTGELNALAPLSKTVPVVALQASRNTTITVTGHESEHQCGRRKSVLLPFAPGRSPS